MHCNAQLVLDAFKFAQMVLGCNKLVIEPLTVVSYSDGGRLDGGVGIKNCLKGVIV